MLAGDPLRAPKPIRLRVNRLAPLAVNIALAIVVLVIDSAFLFGVSPDRIHRPWWWTVALLAFVLITPTHWGLVHEGTHGRLLPDPRASRSVSRGLAVLFGFSFDVVQFGHLMHHRFNGHDSDRPDRMKPGDPVWTAYLRHYFHLLGGHYVLAGSAAFLAFAPQRIRDRALARAFAGSDPETQAIRQTCSNWFLNQDKVLRARHDCLLAVALIILALVRHGASWPVLAVGLAGRAIAYSVLDNLPHHGVAGRGDGAARDLSLPLWISLLVLRHNLHRVHHENPDLPWTSVSNLVSTRPDASYLVAVFRQFGPPTRY